ncbi:MAG TPA: PEP-CTERM sorting domain-containing protein, partial [Pyrinomonadaceae bacterium]|nr:PEP-CTERM sorting domain-containing protein [Pyrinomonadaceae bacterium]
SLTVSVLSTDIEAWGAGVFCGDLKAKVVVNNCNPVPEPATLTLLGIGLAEATAKLRQRRRNQTA